MKPTKISIVPKVVIMFFSNCIYLKKKIMFFSNCILAYLNRGKKTDQIYGIEVIFLPMELLGIHGKETLFNKHGPNLSQTICSHNPVEMEIIRKTKTKKALKLNIEAIKCTLYLATSSLTSFRSPLVKISPTLP